METNQDQPEQQQGKENANTFEFRDAQKFLTSFDLRNAEQLSQEKLTFSIKIYRTMPREVRVLKIIKGIDAEQARVAIQKSAPLILHTTLNLPIAYYLFTDTNNEHRVFELQYLREKSLVKMEWPDDTATQLTGQLLSQAVIALQFLRDVKRIASHSNIKPSNVFFVDGSFMLSDFLLLENVIKKPITIETQKAFYSPLRRTSEGYDKEKDDVWALGAVVLQRLISSPSGDRTHTYLEQLASNELIAQLIQQTKIEQNLKDILLSCLQHDEERRPNLNDLSKLLHEAGILDKYQSKNPFENEPEKVFEPIKQIYEQWLVSHPELDIEKQGELKSYQFNQKWWVRAVWRDGVPVSTVLQGISLDGKEFMVGQHKNGRLEGQALYVNTEVVYEGEWRQDKYEGYGKLTGRQKGYIYTGGFKNNLFEGEGIYKWANGRELKCVWRNGLKNGLGTIKYKKGRVVEQQWSNNRLVPKQATQGTKSKAPKIPFEDRRELKIMEISERVQKGEIEENQGNTMVIQLLDMGEEEFENQYPEDEEKEDEADKSVKEPANYSPNHFYGDLEEEQTQKSDNQEIAEEQKLGENDEDQAVQEVQRQRSESEIQEEKEAAAAFAAGLQSLVEDERAQNSEEGRRQNIQAEGAQQAESSQRQVEEQQPATGHADEFYAASFPSSSQLAETPNESGNDSEEYD